MSIFDHRRVEPTHMRYMDGIQPTQFHVAAARTGQVRDYTPSANEEYLLTLTLKQNFWANKCEREIAEKYAIQAMAEELYRDVLKEIPRALLAIQSGDKMGAIAAVLRIKDATNPYGDKA